MYSPAIIALVLLAAPAATSADERMAEIGQPASLLVQPPLINLTGPRAMQQVLVTGRYPNGSDRDLTALCSWEVAGAEVVEIKPHGFLVPRQEGPAQLVVRVGGCEARVPMEVHDLNWPQPVSFRREMMGALNISGCNSGS